MVQGLVVMSGELEAAYRSISMAKVPDLWARLSYPSLKPLPSYLEDLYARLAMLQVPSLLSLCTTDTSVHKINMHFKHDAVQLDLATVGNHTENKLSLLTGSVTWTSMIHNKILQGRLQPCLSSSA